MPEENKPAEVPTSMDDVMARIEKARQEEKGKLYPQIERLTQDVQERTKKVEELAAQQTKREAEIKRMNDELTALKASMSADGQLSVDELVSNVSKNALEEVRKAYDERFQKLTADLEEQKKLAAARELELVKDRAIKEAGDDIIPEMVKGETKDQILASIALAKQVKARIRAETLEKLQKTGGGTGQLTLNPSTSSAAVATLPTTSTPQGATSEELLLASVKTMTPEEYARNREVLLRIAERRAQGLQM